MTQNMNILWDINIQTNCVIEHRSPDITVVDKDKQTVLIINIAIPALPGDVRVDKKEQEKIDKYQDLAT